MNSRVMVVLALLLCFSVGVLGQRKSWEDYIRTGDSAITQARPSDAEPNYREALKLSEKFKEKDPRRAVSLIKLAESLNLQSRLEEAEMFAQRSISALDRAISGEKSKDWTEEYSRTETTVTILNQAAGIFLANRKYTEAESNYKRVIAIREEDAKPKEPKGNEDFLKLLGQAMIKPRVKVATAYDELAKLYFVQKRFEEAEVLYGRSIKIREEEYGLEDSAVATSLSNLAAVYAAQGKFGAAEELFVRAVRIYEQSNWLEKPEVAVAFENYALLLKKTGRQGEASVMLDKARRVRAKLQ